MEYKTKTIVWEDNNEPPKDYIWVKADGKAYEFDYADRKWKESKTINSISSCSAGPSEDIPTDLQIDPISVPTEPIVA